LQQGNRKLIDDERKLDVNEIIGSSLEKTSNGRRCAFMLRRKKRRQL
jgi:hypothetical protein